LVVQGQRAAFDELLRRHYEFLERFLYSRLHERTIAEDLTQETFLEAYRALRAGRPPADFLSWLVGIARNQCGKWLRRKRPALLAPRDLPERAEPATETVAQELEEQRRLQTAIEGEVANLSPDNRVLLRLKHEEGNTCEEIARKLGRPVGTVRSQLARLYKQLRERLTP